jgi:hypothetical protein
MTALPPAAPPTAGRIDPAAVGSALLAVSWPLIGAILVPPVADGLPGGFGRGAVALGLICVCWLGALGLGAFALVRRTRVQPPWRGRWLAIAGIALTVIQIAVAATIVTVCNVSPSRCTFTF